MMITSSLHPIQLFQTRFQLHCSHKHFNSCCKEEHFKSNRNPWTQIQMSNFANILYLAQTMVSPHNGSLNSWNHWINEQPLYQSLFWPLIQSYFMDDLNNQKDIFLFLEEKNIFVYVNEPCIIAAPYDIRILMERTLW